jgi:hypothetical protein
MFTVGGIVRNRTARGLTIAISASLIAAFVPTRHAEAQMYNPAPQGRPAALAEEAIQKNWDTTDCPAVVNAWRLKDGKIIAVCSNGERFLVFSTLRLGNMAMKCSVAAKFELTGLPDC